MKKILFFAALIFILVELNAHGAYLIENLKIKSTCTGGASGINSSENKPDESTYQDKKDLEKYYQIPTMSFPDVNKNNFPMLNQNCMFGLCIPK